MLPHTWTAFPGRDLTDGCFKSDSVPCLRMTLWGAVSPTWKHASSVNMTRRQSRSLFSSAHSSLFCLFTAETIFRRQILEWKPCLWAIRRTVDSEMWMTSPNRNCMYSPLACSDAIWMNTVSICLRSKPGDTYHDQAEKLFTPLARALSRPQTQTPST